MNMKLIVLPMLLFVVVCGEAFSQRPLTNEEKKIPTKDSRNQSIDSRTNDMRLMGIKSGVSEPPRTIYVFNSKYSKIRKEYKSLQTDFNVVVEAFNRAQNGKKLETAKLRKYALNISETSIKIQEALFKSQSESADTAVVQKGKTFEDRSLGKMVFELDKSIGNFVTSPMFMSVNVVDAETYKKAQIDLVQIERLSAEIAAIAARK